MRKPSIVGLLASALTAATATAGTITTYLDRASYEAAVPPQNLENFTDSSHFPITTGVLNSETDLPEIGIFPGMIQPGVTYSTPVGQGFFFNIDAGGGYTGGFLDGFEPSDREVTMVFHLDDPNAPRTVNAFGFDLGTLGSTDFDVKITFADGSQQDFNFPYPNDSLGFFGFQSDAKDIASVVIGNNGGFFGFDFDNFTYDTIRVEECYPDFTGDGLLDLFDFLQFINEFDQGTDRVDCDESGSLDFFDFLCFTNAFNEGC
jgi:hypothetical protein